VGPTSTWQRQEVRVNQQQVYDRLPCQIFQFNELEFQHLIERLVMFEALGIKSFSF
jgi:DNA-binding helix-hairpin-helix protein with protein kinase domain